MTGRVAGVTGRVAGVTGRVAGVTGRVTDWPAARTSPTGLPVAST